MRESSELESVVYVSTAVADMSAAGLFSILSKARERNLRDGVTGALMYADRTFIQVLEGPPAAIDAALARITKDKRHRAMMVLLRKRVSRRAFPGWSLGFPKAEGELEGVFQLTAGSIDGMRDSGVGEDVVALIRQFYRCCFPHETPPARPAAPKRQPASERASDRATSSAASAPRARSAAHA